MFAGADASISIPVLSIDLPLTDIYGGIDFDYRRQFSSYGGLAQRRVVPISENYMAEAEYASLFRHTYSCKAVESWCGREDSNLHGSPR